MVLSRQNIKSVYTDLYVYIKIKNIDVKIEIQIISQIKKRQLKAVLRFFLIIAKFGENHQTENMSDKNNAVR